MTRTSDATRMPLALRAFVAVLVLGLVLTAARIVGSPLNPLVDGAVGEIIYDGVLVGSAALCLARGVLLRMERSAWLLMGLGLAAYSGGNIVWSVAYTGVASPAFPSLSDALWLACYPAAYGALAMLMRARVPELNPRLWLDGVIALLVACALSAAVIVEAVHKATGGDFAAVVTNLAYPIGDMLLSGLVLGAMAAGRGRLDRTWLCFALGILIFAAADGMYAYQAAEGTYVEWGLLDLMWPVATLVIGLAAWQPAVRTRRPDHVPGVGVPVASAVVAIGVLVYDHFERVSDLAAALVGAALLTVVARFVLTHRQSRARLVTTRRQAATDSLTGLGNRFALMRDIEAIVGDARPHALLLFDLDGFKNYNDAYGHPAGDALLSRLGARLAEAVAGRGTAYRMGGDEFCVLAPCAPAEGPEALIVDARAALSERGEGFAVGASCGHALLPEEAADGSEALRVADRRLYAEKNSGRISARMQSAGVLRRALDEWDADLGSHGHDVAVMAAVVARGLGLDTEAVERVAAAAELHDVGKIAVPRAILHKRGPLNEEEWGFMRRHTVIGERIVQAAPALVGVGQLIRSSHERWDGTGYPDRLAGDEIPLGSQIVFICDAFSAMTTDRAYRRGMSEAEALAELRRHAGTQFAPHVVEAFVTAWSASRRVAQAA
jgi:two-component system, cell cycle response regulator